MIEPLWIDCPYCGERFETTIDSSAGDQQYIEDCQVCCRPIEVAFHLAEDGSLATLTTRRDDD